MHPGQTPTDRSKLRCVPALAGLAVLVATGAYAEPAFAITVAGGLGFDRLSGPDSSASSSVLAFSTVEVPPGDLTLAAIAFDDARVGNGLAGFLNAGVPVASELKLRIVTSRSRGNEGYAAWRFRAGPEARLPWQFVFGAYHERLADNRGARSELLGFEIGRPLRPELWCRVGGSLVSRSGGPRSPQGSGSLAWRVARHVQLHGALTVGRTVLPAGGSPSASPSGGLPILSRLDPPPPRTAATMDEELEMMGLLGIRLLIP